MCLIVGFREINGNLSDVTKPGNLKDISVQGGTNNSTL